MKRDRNYECPQLEHILVLPMAYRYQEQVADCKDLGIHYGQRTVRKGNVQEEEDVMIKEKDLYLR